MKKFIISILAIAVAVSLSSTTAFAESYFNNPAALPTITVVNATTGQCAQGPINGCWKESATAVPGDVIAVQVFYDNTSSETATSTTLGIQPSRSGTTVTFNGSVASTNGPRSNGLAIVTLSQTTTITYMDASDSRGDSIDYQSLLGSSGINIGDVTPGTSGWLVAHFRVNTVTNTGGGGGTTTPPASCAINNFAANPTSINLGSTSNLSWTTSNCTYVSITGVGSNLATDNSGYTVTPTNTTTYRLTAYPGGATASATVTVTNNNNTTNYGCSYYNNCTVTPPPTNNYCSISSFYVDSNSINQGQTTTLHWITTGSNSVYITGFGNENSTGSMSISPYVSTNYELTVNGNNCSGNTSQSVNVTVNQQQYYTSGGTTSYAQPQAITTVAAALGSYSAQLNGIAVPNLTYGTTTAWFEYGPTTSLGSRTDTQNVNGYSGEYPYSANISGLNPGATYYYRAVVQNQNGIAYGSVVPFTTSAASTYTPPVKVYVQSRTVTRSAASTVRTNTGLIAESQPSLFKLEVDSNVDHMCIGGNISYTVNYQNISSQVLGNSILRITLPGELTYGSSSQGDYDVTDRTITVSLGQVQPGEQGSVTVIAQVDNQAVVGKLAVITATMVYTNPTSQAQEQAIAYSLITVSNDCPSVLGASVFGFGGFLPQTLLAWLLLILIILALIVLARSLYNKKEEPVKTQ